MTTTTNNPVTARMAEWAAGLRFEDLPAETVHQAKRFLLDSLACALGGFAQHDVKIARAMHGGRLREES